MLTFKQFVEDTSNQDKATKWEDAIRDIKEKCKPYLKSNPSIPLFRGVASSKSRIGFFPHPQGRKPADSDEQVNFAFNVGAQLAFEIPSIRTRTVFATGDWGLADSFGDVTFFFPAGDYQLMYSKFIQDSWINVDEFWDEMAQAVRTVMQGAYSAPKGWHSAVEKFCSEISVEPARWIRADATTERLTMDIAADLFKSDTGNFDSFIELFGEGLKMAMQKMYKITGDAEEAAKSGNEIFFYQTDGYFAIPVRAATFMMMLDPQVKGEPKVAEVYEWLLKQIHDA